MVIRILLMLLCLLLATPLAAEPPGPDVCPAPVEPEAISYQSDTLELELREDGRGPIVIPPFEFRVFSKEDIESLVEMELTIHDPKGKTNTQTFRYSNMHEQCDPHCLPTRDTRCAPRQCRMQRFAPRAQRIDPQIYRPPVPGVWTFVLYRKDNGDRVSVNKTLFKGGGADGEALSSEACEMFPSKLGPYTRTGCERAVVPLGTTTNHWGIKAQYAYGTCRANAFVLPLAHNYRVLFDEGLRTMGTPRDFAEGTAIELPVKNAVGHTWLAHHHLYLVGGPAHLPDYELFVRGFLSAFPDIGGPQRTVPSCAETRDQVDVTVAGISVAEATGNQARFGTYFDGNLAAGATLDFHNQHPLAKAGFRRKEILHSVDGTAVVRRGDVPPALEALSRPGTHEFVVSRARLEASRCLRITVK